MSVVQRDDARNCPHCRLAWHCVTVSPPRGAVGHVPIWKPVPSRQPDEREPLFHSEAYAIGKKEKPPFLPEEPSSSSEEDDPIPDELLCLICKDIMTDAVVIPCCGNSYCDECKARPGPRGGGVPPGHCRRCRGYRLAPPERNS